jgi:hypothetical protein
VDPNLLAHSRRVHVDAILACTMLLSALALLVYAGQPGLPRWRYLILSGVFAGLAWLTKLPALFLIPFTLLALGVRYLLRVGGRGDPAPTAGTAKGALPWDEIKGFLLWLAVAGLVSVALWPSMWVQPGQVLSLLGHTFSWGMGAPHTSALTADAPSTPGMQFFLGRIVDDPGAGYYPLITLFRLSPIVLIFLPIGLVAAVVGRKGLGVERAWRLLVGLGAAYVFFFALMLTFGAKKLESYVLPVFPMVDVLAAIGLAASIAWLTSVWRRIVSRSTSAGRGDTASALALYSLTIVGILAISLLWLRLQPYYSAYFNPLVGGAGLASRIFVFGGGEGLDLAADYLNQKPEAEGLVVSSAYPDHVFRYHFRGETWPLSQGNWTGLWLLADYVISYFSYTQRDLPAAEVVSFLETLEPEYVARINGVDYARVYKVPPLVSPDMPQISHPAEVDLDGEVTFLGYDLETGPVPSGEEIEITLYWQGQSPLETGYSVFLRLINGAYDVWGGQDGAPLGGAMPTSMWEEGMVIADVRRLPILPGTPPGIYQIEIGMYDPSNMADLGPVDGEDGLLLGPVEVVRNRGVIPPSPQYDVEANLGDRVRLLGYALEGQPEPGQTLHLTLFWEALSPMTEDYTVFVHLLGQDGVLWGQRDSQPVTGFYPTSLWTEGEFVRDQYDLAVSEEAPPGAYTLKVGMYAPGTGERLPVLGSDGQVLGDSVTLGPLPENRP